MQKVIETWVAFQAHMFVARNNERGQGTLEYVGMIIVAAFIVMAVLKVTNGLGMDTTFTNKIKEVLDFSPG